MNNKFLRLVSATVLCSVVATSCVKDRNVSTSSASQKAIQDAKEYFDNNLANHPPSPISPNHRAIANRTPLWQNAYVAKLSVGQAIIVPMNYNNIYVTSDASTGEMFALSDLTRLVLFRDSSNQFHGRVVTYVPDSAAQPATSLYTGIVFYEDWRGNSVTKPWHLNSQNPGGSPTSAKVGNTKEVDYDESIQVCNTIDGYNYSVDDPDGGEYWSETSCNMYSLQSVEESGGLGGSDLGGIFGGGGAGRISPAMTIKLLPPTNPIGSISDYMKCYTASDAASYSVTVAVEQPVLGSREPWTFSETGLGGSSSGNNPVNVGHTFLIFTENTGSSTITRNVGFYPQTMVMPGSPSSQGVLDNDQNTGYDVSLTVTVTSSQFFNILNYVYQGNNVGYDYNLNSNNCTTFALDAMDQGGVSIPATVGTWAFGSQGLDPGDLGEDIRGMQLSGNMTRSTVGNAHPNAGTCY